MFPGLVGVIQGLVAWVAVLDILYQGAVRNLFHILILAGCLFAPGKAFCDGCFVAYTTFANVAIPDQRALIHYTNGIETLVIDTAFLGSGTNFAWVVPLPAPPKIEPATAGLFNTLQFVFQPRIKNGSSAGIYASVILGIFLLIIIWGIRYGEIVSALLVCGVFFMLLGLMLPAFSTASGGAAEVNAARPEVLGQKRVGIYDTVTLASKDGSAIRTWLGHNGFPVSSNHTAAIDSYAKDGWCFVASRIRLDAPMTEAARPHPLAFTFQTKRPVYPLRLTGIGNGKCQIDLYVFGSGQASAPGFHVERSTTPRYPEHALEGTEIYVGLHSVRIRHPLLRRLVLNAPYATKLTGELTSRDMEQDAYITWSTSHEYQPAYFTKEGAALTTASIVVPILILVSLICYAWHDSDSRWAFRTATIAGRIAWIALLAAPVIYLSLPKIKAIVTRHPAYLNRAIHTFEIPGMLETAIKQRQKEEDFRPDLAWVRSEIKKHLPDNSNSADQQMNRFTGQPIREEDSPGNYTLRETTNGVEYLWYDIDGGEKIEGSFR